MFIHRKSKRPTIEEATAKAIAVEAAETEAERKGREQREAMEAAIMSPGTTYQKQAIAACPRCSECVGQKHHWIEAAVYEPEDPAYECKHCDAACGMRSDGAPNGKLMPRRAEDDSALDGDPELEAALDEAAAAEATPTPARPSHYADRFAAGSDEGAIAASLRRVSNAVTSMGSHRVTVVQGSGALMVEQVCLVCRAGITSGAPTHDTEMETISAVGVSARKARIKHRCDPVERQLPATMTRAELDELAQELERDGTDMVKRSIEIAKLAKERA